MWICWENQWEKKIKQKKNWNEETNDNKVRKKAITWGCPIIVTGLYWQACNVYSLCSPFIELRLIGTTEWKITIKRCQYPPHKIRARSGVLRGCIRHNYFWWTLLFRWVGIMIYYLWDKVLGEWLRWLRLSLWFWLHWCSGQVVCIS